jgi:hypothetical protein
MKKLTAVFMILLSIAVTAVAEEIPTRWVKPDYTSLAIAMPESFLLAGMNSVYLDKQTSQWIVIYPVGTKRASSPDKLLAGKYEGSPIGAEVISQLFNTPQIKITEKEETKIAGAPAIKIKATDTSMESPVSFLAYIIIAPDPEDQIILLTFSTTQTKKEEVNLFFQLAENIAATSSWQAH